MTWLILHRSSEAAVSRAASAAAANDRDRVVSALREAAHFETEAMAAADDPSAGRTYGITAVSAVALWLKAGDHARALEVAGECLRGNRLPPFARHHLIDMLETGVTEFGIGQL